MKTLAETVKDFARNRWSEIFPALSSAPAEIFANTKTKHPCPRCGGKDRFRFTNMDGDGSCVCSKCPGGQNLGDGLSVLMWLNGENFSPTLDKLKKYLGIHGSQGYRKVSRKKGDYRVVVERWIKSSKPGISYDAVIRNGGEIVGVADQGEDRTCIRLPCYNHKRRCGNLDIPIDGRPLHTKNGEETFKKLMPKTQPGWFGKAALDSIKKGTAELVVKCEGPTDMLAVDTALNNVRYVGLANNFGASHILAREDLEILRGLKVVIVGDNDEVGRAGAYKWAEALLGIAASVKIVFPDQEGEDLREVVAREGKDGLKALLKKAKELDSETVKSEAPKPTKREIPDREEKEPIVLAEKFCKGSRILVHAKVPWVQQPEGHWLPTGDENLRARVQHFLKDRLERLFTDEYNLWGGHGEPPRRTELRSRLVQEVAQLAAQESTVSEELRPNSLLLPARGGELQFRGPLNWLRFQNGILDIDKLIVGEPDFFNPGGNDNWFSSIYLPFPFDHDRGCQGIDFFLKFLEERVGDEKAIKTIQQFFGYTLTQNLAHNIQKFLFLHGDGATGKSTLIAVARALVGVTGASGVRLDEFENDKFSFYDTYGKLLNAADETGQMDKARETWLKTFAALEGVRFQRKFGQAFLQPPTAKLLIASNPPPAFKDRSRGIWRRMLYVQMESEVKKPTLGMTDPNYWIKSGMMPGIINWSLAGLMELLTDGEFAESDAMKAVLSEHIEESRPEEAFFAECIEVSDPPGAEMDLAESFALYQKWCEKHGTKASSSSWFGRRVSSYFGKESQRRMMNGIRRRYFRDLRIVSGARRVYALDPIPGLRRGPEA